MTRTATSTGTVQGRGLGIGAITITSVLWGTTGTAATFAPDAGPSAIGSAALGIGGLLQALIALPALRAACHRLRVHWGLLALGGLAVMIVGEQLSGLGWVGITVIAAVLVILAVAPTNAADSGGSAGPDPSRGPEDQQRAPMPVP